MLTKRLKNLKYTGHPFFTFCSLNVMKESNNFQEILCRKTIGIYFTVKVKG
eukprot:UN20059